MSKVSNDKSEDVKASDRISDKDQSSDTDGPAEMRFMSDGVYLSDEISILVRDYLQNPKKVKKESIEMFLNPQAFRPDTLYQISL